MSEEVFFRFDECGKGLYGLEFQDLSAFIKSKENIWTLCDQKLLLLTFYMKPYLTPVYSAFPPA